MGTTGELNVGGAPATPMLAKPPYGQRFVPSNAATSKSEIYASRYP